MCSLKLEVLLNEKDVVYQAKNVVRRDLLRPIAGALKVLKTIIPDEHKKMMDEAVMNDEAALQYEYISSCFTALPNEMRNRVEDFITGLMKEIEATKA